MRLVLLRWLVCVFCCATCLVGGTGLALAQATSFAAGSSSTGGSGASSSSSLFESALVIPAVQVLDGGQDALAARRARLSSPEAVIAREASRTAFRHLSAAAAGRLAREAFPRVVDHPEGGLPALRSGERVMRYMSSTTAQVSLPDGKRAVIDSLGPIARQASPGRFVPVDLGLSDAGGAFVPRSSIMPVRIPKQLSTGVALGSSGVSVTPVNSGGVPLGGSQGALDGASVFYANTQADADTLVKPTTVGFEIDAVLRSVDSPSKLYFRVAMPLGARLRQDGGSGEVNVVKEGAAIATVSRPIAQDAAGTSVAVSMSVSGDLLVLSVAHGSVDLQYPVEVDPGLSTDTLLTGYGGPTNWKFATWWSTEHKHEEHQFKSVGWGENGNLTDEATGTYKTTPNDEWAEFVYQTQGESDIYEESYSTEETNNVNPNANIESSIEIESNNGKPEQEAYKLLSVSENGSQSGTLTAFMPKNHNFVTFRQMPTAEGNHYRDVLKGETVHIAQSEAVHPTISYDTADEKLLGGEWVNVLNGENKWLGPNSGAFAFTVKETGMGIGKIEAGTVEHFVYTKDFLSELLCSGVQCPQEVKEEYTYHSGLPDGHDLFWVYAWSPPSTFGSASVYMNVDATKPTGLTLTGLPAGNVITGGQYHLRAEATDGSGVPSSGIKSLKLGLDERELLPTKSGSCTPGPCTVVSEWTINGEAFGAGKHKLTLTARDNAENFENKEYAITVRHAAPLAAGPGSVDPVTGAMTLGASDVSIGGGAGSLGVSRSFNSRQLTAGAQGPLGPQWKLSVSGAQEVEQEPSGSVVLVAPDGSLTTFESDGSGGFISPKGDENLVLSAEKEGGTIVAYLLKDPAAGTTVKYTQPGGAGPWVIASSEGALSKNTGEKEVFKWERVEGVTRPKEALAPEPEGVSGCATELKQGCRALLFTYATSQTAFGELPSQWGDYKNRLKKVSFKAYNPSSKAMEEKVVAEYSYDTLGRLRAEWDPRVSPVVLKTTYGYDKENRVVAVNPPGQEPWLLRYGTTASDSSAGRLLSVTRVPASHELVSSLAPFNTVLPTLSSTSPVIGTTLEVSGNGTWNNEPLAYSYGWEDCYTYESVETCTPIPGAVNKSYTPQARDAGYTLRGQVTAVNANGATVVTTSASSALTAPAPTYWRKWGEAGETAGKFNTPRATAIDSSGNVWVTDSSNARVQEFSTSGAFIKTFGWGVTNGAAEFQICTSGCKAGTVGSGNGQFSTPKGIAINQSTNNVYVLDGGTQRVEEFSSSGSFIRAFNASTPEAIAIAPVSGDVWVGESASSRVEEFSETGGSLGSFGSEGSGNGQFHSVAGIAFSGPNAYVLDPGNQRVQEFSTSGQYIAKFGSKGTGNGQFESPCGISTEPVSGDLYVGDRGNNRVEEFNPAGTFIVAFGKKGTGNGEFTNPEGLAVNSAGDVYVADAGNNRVQEFEPKYSTNNPLPAPPALTTSAVMTFVYNVPLSGLELDTMTKVELEKWGQKDLPTEATAVYPPDEPMGWPAKDYKRATISYYDELARMVNVAAPSGGLSTSEYNETNEVVRSLSADNRAAALAEGANSKADSELWDTKSEYNSDGTRLLSKKGPQHKIRLASGTTEKLARDHIRYFYNEGAPGGETFDLVTKSIDTAEYEGGDHEERVTTTSYSGQQNLGWLLRAPTSVTTGGVTTATVYDPFTGKVVESRPPLGGSLSLTYKALFSTVTTTFAPQPGLAVNSKGNLWFVNETSLVEYSPGGTKLLSVGKSGSGNGEFNAPRGVAIGPGNTVWVVDTGNNRVQEFNEAGEYLSTFGTVGEANGNLKAPRGIAFGPNGEIWVTDAGNNRVEGFNEKGEYQSKFGSTGEGNGQFKEPSGIAVDGLGNVWVVDSGNHRVQEFNAKGEYVRQFGSSGEGNGQFNKASYIAIDANGSLWVSDSARNKVQAFSPTGGYLGCFGGSGSGNGQFSGAHGVAVDSQGNVWVEDAGHSRVQEFAAPTSYIGREYSQQINSGSNHHPRGVAVDSQHNVWVLKLPGETGVVEEYSSSGQLLHNYQSSVAGYSSAGIAIGKTGNLWVASAFNSKLEEFEPEPATEKLKAVRSVPVTSPRGVASDGMGHIVVLPGLETKGEEFDEEGHLVVTFGGSGSGKLKAAEGIAVDAKGNILVADTGNNRVAEFNAKGEYVTQFGEKGTGNGQLMSPKGIVGSDAAGDVWVADSGNHRVEEFNGKGEYLMQFGEKGKLEGEFEEAWGIADDNEGNLWVADNTNNAVQEWSPVAVKGPRDSETIYYSAGANAKTPGCGEHPEWAELPCQSQAAGQPNTPELPVVTDTYNMWDEPEIVTETFGATTRTKKMSYDSAGRLLTNEETSTINTSLPKVTDKYDEKLGVMIEQSTTVGETTKSIKSAYNKLGQLTEYTDADSNKSKYTYEIDGQVEEMNDGKGTQTYAYDATTKQLIKLVDSAGGTFKASYDVEGQMTSELYPDGLNAKYTYNPLGEATGIEYEKTAHCQTACPEVWFKETTLPLIHGETRVRTSTLAKEEYTYDSLGRMTLANEIPVGEGCKSRVYAYDEDSNRTSLTTRTSGTETCATSGGTTENHSYDSADRLADSGVSYETFGNKTKIPAADAEGHEITATFYVDNQTRSQTQNEETITYYTDPAGRTREAVSTGTTNSTAINHYPGPGEMISWTDEGGETWTRNIPGIDGTLSATQKSGAEAVLQLHDLQGNIIATAAKSETETKLLSKYNSTEFGVPVNGTPPKYSWLGASGLKTELPSGATAPGGTGYVPQLGQPLQTQPIVPPGAAPNGVYIAPYESTLTPGVFTASAAFAAGAPAREAARNEAAAKQCVESGACDEDPIHHFRAWEATNYGNELLDDLKDQDTGAAIGILGTIYDLLMGPAETIEALFDHNTIERWITGYGNMLLQCTKELHRTKHPHGGCRASVFDIRLLGVDIKVINFNRMPEVSWCEGMSSNTVEVHWCHLENNEVAAGTPF